MGGDAFAANLLRWLRGKRDLPRWEVSPKDPVLRTCWSPPKRWLATTVTQLPIDFWVEAMSAARATEVIRTRTVRTRNWTMSGALRETAETAPWCPLCS